jgi:ketosteroid isomerase-like protein
MKAFREAIEGALAGTGDFDAVERLLADDVVFTSPAAFKPYPGRELTAAILRGVGRVFTDFRYQREIVDGNQSALIFEANIADTGIAVQGCDFITTNDDGLISELTVMVRPLKGAQALADAMGAQFDQIQQEAIAAMSGADQ